VSVTRVGLQPTTHMSTPDLFTVTFLSRDFQPVTPPRGHFTPLTCSWRAMGGPYHAMIAVEGDPRSLASLSGLLGMPVMIHDPPGEPYWWGYLHGIDFQAGDITQRLRLDELANRLAVLYTLPDGGTPILTGWGEDAGSQSIYGVRERILILEAVSEEMALVWRDTTLARRAYPKLIAGRPAAAKFPALLECHGWYETLGWRYYACGEGDALDTTAQIANIIASCGQYLAGIRLSNPSGVLTSPYRNGLTTALTELELLAGAGDGQCRPYELRIDNNQILVVEQQPVPGEGDWSLGSDGVYYDRFGVRQPRWTNPVGRWVRGAGWAHAPAQPLGGGDGSGYMEAWEYTFS
jgi:hypothetical protein